MYKSTLPIEARDEYFFIYLANFTEHSDFLQLDKENEVCVCCNFLACFIKVLTKHGVDRTSHFG